MTMSFTIGAMEANAFDQSVDAFIYSKPFYLPTEVSPAVGFGDCWAYVTVSAFSVQLTVSEPDWR